MGTRFLGSSSITDTDNPANTIMARVLGMGDGGTDKGEGLSVGYQPLADGLVIDGLEIAHVEDCRVALNATVQ